jgi:hypothetical protein
MMKRKSLSLSKEVLRQLTTDEVGRIAGGLPRNTEPRNTGLCGSGGCTSLIEECRVTMNCGF